MLREAGLVECERRAPGSTARPSRLFCASSPPCWMRRFLLPPDRYGFHASRGSGLTLAAHTGRWTGLWSLPQWLPGTGVRHACCDRLGRPGTGSTRTSGSQEPGRSPGSGVPTAQRHGLDRERSTASTADAQECASSCHGGGSAPWDPRALENPANGRAATQCPGSADRAWLGAGQARGAPAGTCRVHRSPAGEPSTCRPYGSARRADVRSRAWDCWRTTPKLKGMIVT